MNMTPQEFDDVIAVDLRGTWSVSRHAARAMRDQGHGLLLQVISGSAFVGSVGQTNYAASKAGVMGMSMHGISSCVDSGSARTRSGRLPRPT